MASTLARSKSGTSLMRWEILLKLTVSAPGAADAGVYLASTALSLLPALGLASSLAAVERDAERLAIRELLDTGSDMINP